MNRISERVSTALTGVKCPSCGKFVKPILPLGESSAASDGGPQGTGEGRWSFVWRPPSGEVCPECSFPLARYAKRVKWIRIFSAGVVLLTISFLFYVLTRIAQAPPWSAWLLRTGVILGTSAFIVGLVGLVVGGRQGSVEGSPTGP
jgi:hypothetical protein